MRTSLAKVAKNRNPEQNKRTAKLIHAADPRPLYNLDILLPEVMSRVYGLCNTKHFVAHRSREMHSAGVCSHGLYRGACKAGDTPEAVLDVSSGDLGRAPALALLGVGT